MKYWYVYYFYYTIETVGILGWECVSKKGEFQPNDKCLYIEIDSLLPEIPEFEFLRKGCWNETFKKFRLKTIKLRKQLSQGLALPPRIVTGKHYG